MTNNKKLTKDSKDKAFQVGQEEADVSFPASREHVDKLEQELTSKIYETRDQVTANYISVLGIFASIVAFLLIEIQILRNICDFQRLMGFSFFVVGLLLVFVIALHFVLSIRTKEDINKLSIIVVLLTIASVFITGYVVLSKAHDEYICKLSNLDERFELIKNSLDNKEFEKYNELKSEIEKLKNL